MIIIGITGTIGAGKGTVVDYLKERHGFLHFSVREYLTDILKKEGKPVNRDTFTARANQLRYENHPAFIIEELYHLAEIQGKNAILESIRTSGEIELLRSKGNFYLLAIDATPELRFNRILQRNSETDKISFDKFKSDEKREMNSTDPNKQNLQACIAGADHVILNQGSIKELESNVESFLSTININ